MSAYRIRNAFLSVQKLYVTSRVYCYTKPRCSSKIVFYCILLLHHGFYRAMHFSAKRGLAIACRLSVCLSVRPSVTLVDCDHIGRNSSEIISPLVSLECSLSADPNIRGLLQGEHPEILAQIDQPPVDLSVGDIRSQIAAVWLQIAQRSQWRAYRKPPSVIRMVPSLTPTTSFSRKWEFHMPHNTRMAISPQRVIRYTSCLVLG